MRNPDIERLRDALGALDYRVVDIESAAIGQHFQGEFAPPAHLARALGVNDIKLTIEYLGANLKVRMLLERKGMHHDHAIDRVSRARPAARRVAGRRQRDAQADSRSAAARRAGRDGSPGPPSRHRSACAREHPIRLVRIVDLLDELQIREAGCRGSARLLDVRRDLPAATTSQGANRRGLAISSLVARRFLELEPDRLESLIAARAPAMRAPRGRPRARFSGQRSPRAADSASTTVETPAGSARAFARVLRVDRGHVSASAAIVAIQLGELRVAGLQDRRVRDDLLRELLLMSRVRRQAPRSAARPPPASGPPLRDLAERVVRALEDSLGVDVNGVFQEQLSESRVDGELAVERRRGLGERAVEPRAWAYPNVLRDADLSCASVPLCRNGRVAMVSCASGRTAPSLPASGWFALRSCLQRRCSAKRTLNGDSLIDDLGPREIAVGEAMRRRRRSASTRPGFRPTTSSCSKAATAIARRMMRR